MSNIFHFAKRFFGALNRKPPTKTESESVTAILLESEFSLWLCMPMIDQKHSIRVMRRFLSIYPQATPAEVRASLLHDVGKISSNLGVLSRVVATIIGAKGARLSEYHAHEKIGAQMLRHAGSDKTTWQLVSGDIADSPELTRALAALRQADNI